MNDIGESYARIVAQKPANKLEGEIPTGAESAERRGAPKWKLTRDYKLRALVRESLQDKLRGLRHLAAKDKDVKFTTLWHHVYNPDRLAETFFTLKKKGAVGVDNVDWVSYDSNLEENILELSDRLKRGAYHARLVRRVNIPKTGGGTRPLGILTLEDKLVQRVTADILSEVYEPMFHDFSYGFRPGRKQHDALDQLTLAIEREKVSYVLDVDIRAFFDTINHDSLIKFLEHRLADKQVLRHIKKWLHAGILEEDVVKYPEAGTPQGGSISPLLANIYLHYAFDNWAEIWRRKDAQGYMKIIRFADDVVICFQHQADARRFLDEMRTRLGTFSLELHPEKTRLLQFGRFAAERMAKQKLRPETFDFLGFTHICSTTYKGNRFCVLRRSSRKKTKAKLKDIKQSLRRRMHDPIPETGKWLKQVLKGHYNYYNVPRNSQCLKQFRYNITLIWKKMLGRRGQKGYITWERMNRYCDNWLPHPDKTSRHPYPSQRVTV